MAKKMERLSRYYSGLIGLKKTPDALFIIDPRNEYIANTEAQKTNIPVISLMNSDSNIKGIDYPIVGNDSNIPSVNFFALMITQAYKEGQMTVPTK